MNFNTQIVPKPYKIGPKIITTGFTMNKLSKNLLATLSGLALVIFPQLTIAEG